MAQAKKRPKKKTKNLVAKKLRTGEIAVWDADTKSIFLTATPEGSTTVVTRVISGASFRALEEGLGDVIVLV